MEFMAQTGARMTGLPADLAIVGLFEGEDFPADVSSADAALGGLLAAMRERKELTGKTGELVSLHTLGRLPVARLTLVGLGKADAFTPEIARRAAGAAAKTFDRAQPTQVTIALLGEGRAPAGDLARAIVEGVLLATYRFDQYRSTPRPPLSVQRVTILAPEGTQVEGDIAVGAALAAATNFARDLGNEPPNVLTPAELARRSESMAGAAGLTVEIFDPVEMTRRGMGGMLAVGQGSENPPRMIIVHYRGDSTGSKPTLGLIGKGITFDTGGISLKPGADMHLMKTDMGGAAAMLGAMHAIGALRPALNVTAIVASAENMPDGKAFRPGDILRAMNGKTIEVQNTDAEGRLVLADALSYAVELGLAPIVDAATLTGACSVALGPHYAGLFANSDAVRDQVLAAARAAGERIWPLPLDPEYRSLLDSSCADMRNVGGREGGAIIAAVFLQEFVANQPWAHLDIAPTAFADNEGPYLAKGLATGFPVRTLAQLALDLANA
jgi:leucyl aminopeptidase